MENKNFWWLKSSRSDSQLGRNLETNNNITSTALSEGRAPSSLSDFVDIGPDDSVSEEAEVDIGSIIDEMNRLAAESPLGPYEKDQVRIEYMCLSHWDF